MAAKVLGTAHIYGVAGTVTSATVQSFSSKVSCKNTAETLNESGNEIERRYDDQQTEVTVECKIQSGFTPPAPGDTFVYATVTYEVVSVDRKEEAKGHVIVTLTLLKTANVSYT